MTKLKQPIISMEARGTLADVLTFQRLQRDNVVRIKPWPTYRRTLSQAYQRWLYQDAGFYWATLTTTQKDAYRATASRLHIPRYAAFLRYYLTNLPDILAYWKLDELTGAITLDSSTNTNNGTIFGPIPVPGTISRARYFDGIDDYINCGNDPSLDLPATFTIECFTTPHAFENDKWELSKHLTALPWYAYSLGHRLNKFRAIVHTTGGTIYCDSDIVYTVDRKYHLAFTYDGSWGKLYVDALLQADVDNVVGTPVPTTQPLVIGSWSTTTARTNSTIDHVIIWNRPLSQHQLQLHSERRWP